MRAIFPVLLALVLLICTSCGGGGGGATSPSGQTGAITGPSSVTEGSSAQYAVERSVDAPASYRWNVAPASLGTFTSPQAESTNFKAGDVSKDTEIEISVEITPDPGSPVVSKLKVLVKDKPDTGGDPQEPQNGRSPVASAQADPPSLNPGGYVQFLNQSVDPDGSQDIVTSEWDFSYDAPEGFHVDSTDKEPYVEFPDLGTYLVQLRVTDSTANMDMLDNPITVVVTDGHLTPVAKAICFPATSPICEPVQFQNNGSYPRSGSTITKFEWDWENDGVYDEEGLFAYHTWNTTGTYYVQFRVTDDQGQTGELSSPLAVVVENLPPIADASADKYNLKLGQSVGFDASNSHDPDCDGSIVLYEWDWENDGTYDATGKFVSRFFEYSGVYNVMLRVTDDEGASTTIGSPLVITVESGQTMTWGGSDSDSAYAVALDESGNLFVTGFFSGTVDFDPTVAVAERTALNSSSAFLAKFDLKGAFQWVTTWGNDDFSTGNDIFISSPGYIYVAGTSTVVKFNQFGDILWTYDNGAVGEGVAVDDYTGVIVTGHFVPDGQSYADIVLTSLSYDGNLNWEHRWGGPGCDQAFDVVVDSNGDPFITGHYEYSVDFDPTDGTNIVNATDSTDSFLAKFSSAGGLMWVKSWDATDSYAMDIDASNCMYVSGYYEGYTDFDPGPGVNAYSGDMGSYVAKFDTAGGLMWVAGWTEYVPPPPPPGGGYDPAFDVKCDNNGNVYVVGSYDGSVDFDPTGNNDVHGNGGAYIAHYTSNGNYQRVLTWGAHYDTGWDNAFGLATDGYGQAFVAGDFGGCADFGVGEQELHASQGADDAFVMNVPTSANW